MQISRLSYIAQLEQHLDEARKNEIEEKYLVPIILLIKSQKESDDALVMCSNGDCEREGYYAPVDGNGNIDFKRVRRFREEEPFPEGGDWIQTS